MLVTLMWKGHARQEIYFLFKFGSEWYESYINIYLLLNGRNSIFFLNSWHRNVLRLQISYADLKISYRWIVLTYPKYVLTPCRNTTSKKSYELIISKVSNITQYNQFLIFFESANSNFEIFVNLARTT